MSRAGELLAVAALVGCSLAIGVVQPRLDLHGRKIRLEDETSSLPPPREVKAMALGYNAAAADMLWASLLVQHGIHSNEHRGFDGVERYIEGILAVDPLHPQVYQFVDTLLVSAKPGHVPVPDDARAVRAILERGTRERPYDPDVWLHYGQFLAFLAPSVLTDHDEKEAWRRDGAFAIARAVELGADADRSLAASTILSNAGEKKAAIEQLQRAFAITDNAETRRQIILKLHRLQATTDAEDAVSKVEYDWRTHFPFLSRGAALLVGPSRSPAACAGAASFDSPACASDWSDVPAR